MHRFILFLIAFCFSIICAAQSSHGLPGITHLLVPSEKNYPFTIDRNGTITKKSKVSSLSQTRSDTSLIFPGNVERVEYGNKATKSLTVKYFERFQVDGVFFEKLSGMKRVNFNENNGDISGLTDCNVLVKQTCVTVSPEWCAFESHRPDSRSSYLNGLQDGAVVALGLPLFYFEIQDKVRLDHCLKNLERPRGDLKPQEVEFRRKCQKLQSNAGFLMNFFLKNPIVGGPTHKRVADQNREAFIKEIKHSKKTLLKSMESSVGSKENNNSIKSYREFLPQLPKIPPLEYSGVSAPMDLFTLHHMNQLCLDPVFDSRVSVENLDHISTGGNEVQD